MMGNLTVMFLGVTNSNNIDDFNNHWELMHEENRCQLCKQLFSGSRSMKVHSSVHEPSKSNLQGSIENKSATDGFKCWFCPGVFRMKDTLLDHVDAFHVGCVCLECGSCLMGSEQCGDHIADQHPPQKVLEEDQDRCHYQCSACFHVFAKRIEAERHFVEQHFVAENEKVFQCCPYCPEVFQSYVRLNDHIQWEHGFEEIDDNAIVVKNRESQQFFQCEICDHFFQTESILDEHIKGHQVEKVARYKVIPQRRSLSSKRRRKHSKKHKRKSQKENGFLADSNSRQHSKESVHLINANDVESMDVEIVQNGELTSESGISIITTKPLPVEQGNVQPQLACQSPNVLSSGSNDRQSNLPVTDISTFDTLISTSLNENKPHVTDTIVSTNPEIEQAVASICGPTLEEIDTPLKSNETNNLHTESSTVLPLTGGTLEIENAVNSILGETSHINDNTAESAIIFDIKPKDETIPHKFVTPMDLQAGLPNVALLEKDILGNGLLTEKENNGISGPLATSDNIAMTMDSSIEVAVKPDDSDTMRENCTKAPLSKSYQSEIFDLPESESNECNSVESAYSLQKTEDINSSENLNGFDANYPEMAKTIVTTPHQTKQHLESLEIKDSSTNELSSIYSNTAPKFDISHSQFQATKDTGNVCPTQDNDSTMVLPLSYSTENNASQIKMNNGNASDH